MTYTTNWFRQSALPVWKQLLPEHFPDGIGRALEIGSFEGQSAAYLLRYGVRDLTCVDTWRGSEESHFRQLDMDRVYARFTENMNEAATESGNVYRALRMDSAEAMRGFLDAGEVFDFIYIDGSHTAADVLQDGLLAFRLVRSGGWIYFDDYTWVNDEFPDDPRLSPQSGINAFCNLKAGKISITASKMQMHVQKL